MDEAESTDHDHDERDSRVHVFHVTAPTCWWSWGFEAVFNRLPLVYGDQIEIVTATFCVYNDFEEYKQNNGIENLDQVDAWAKEASEKMDVALLTDLAKFSWPKSVFPASLAVMAANLQGKKKAERFKRALVRMFCVEGKDVTQDSVMDEAVREAGLDAKAFEEAAGNEEKLMKLYEAQGEGLPHLPLGYYNIAITDGDRRTVVIDHAFEPADVEGAIDWLSDGKLEKRQPTDILTYLREHGSAPLGEVRKVFGLSPEKARLDLDALVKQGQARSTVLAWAPHWSAT